jgi:hypothetical protein
MDTGLGDQDSNRVDKPADVIEPETIEMKQKGNNNLAEEAY